jgi:hypothetical protein
MGLLLQEHHLILIVAEASEVAVVRPVKELAALVGTFAWKQIALVVTVKVHLERLISGAVALQQLILDLRFARRPNQGRDPVFGGEDVIQFGAWARFGPIFGLLTRSGTAFGIGGFEPPIWTYFRASRS